MTTATLSYGKAPLPAMPGWLALIFALLLAGFGLSCLAGGAQPALPGVPTLERSVKAAYLSKFLGYVEFGEAAPNAPLNVGVLAADDIATELARITAGRPIGGRPVQVRRLRDGDTLEGLQMVFIGADAARPLQALRAASEKSVLSVTEMDNGLQQGAMINFRLVDDRVRFEVSLPAAEKGGLRLSSRLLSVAYHIQKDKP
jgi:hypothetical protein